MYTNTIIHINIIHIQHHSKHIHTACYQYVVLRTNYTVIYIHCHEKTGLQCQRWVELASGIHCTNCTRHHSSVDHSVHHAYLYIHYRQCIYIYITRYSQIIALQLVYVYFFLFLRRVYQDSPPHIAPDLCFLNAGEQIFNAGDLFFQLSDTFAGAQIRG